MRTQAVLSLALVVGGCISRAPANPLPQAPEGEVWLSPDQVKSAQIEIEPVTDQPVAGTIRVAGRVTFDDLRVAHVFSPVTGKITKILAQPGQRVRKGEKLCVIQSPDLGSAASDMAKAQAALLQAQKDWKRQKELVELHAAPQRDYEAAESAYLNARAEMERAQRKAKLLRGGGGGDNVTQEYALPSPIDGEVIMRGANPGLEVQGQYTGGATVELYTIGELDRVWVLADVFEMDLPRVKKGTDVSVSVLSYPDRKFSGTVEWISGSLDPISRTAKVRFSVDNGGRLLRPEMFGTASISVDPDRKMAIKRSALLLLGKQTVAFINTGTTPEGLLRFEQRPVAVDEMNGGDYVPVRGGVERNERVVVKGEVLLLGEI